MIIKIRYLILILVLIKCINGFKIESNTIIEKSTNVLGVEFDYALFDLEFDREIHRVKNVPCGNYDCTLPIIDDGNGGSVIDCSCDYTNKTGECPKILDPLCGNQTLLCDIDKCNIDTNIFPDGWKLINSNEPTNFESFNFQKIQIRYKANALICEGIKIEGIQNQGRFYLSVGNTPDTSISSFVRYTPNISPDTFIQPAFCPSDNGFSIDGLSLDIWNLDTYFITIIPQSNYINFNLTIVSKEIPPTSKLPTTTCTNVTSEHQCIVDGVPVSGVTQDSGAFIYYTFQVTQPSVISFAAPSIYQDIDFFVSDDPNNQKPNYDNFAKWDCIIENDDYLVLSLRENLDGTPKTLYIGVTTFYPSVYSFTVTTLGYKEYVPIHQNYPRGGAFSILGSSRLILPNNSIYKCNYWSSCTYFSILFPFKESFPVWPIPTQFIEDYRFNQITYSNNETKSNHYSSSFLLKTAEGDFTQLNKLFSDLIGSKIEFLNTLVDIDGNPLEGIFEFNVVNNLPCDYKEFKLLLENMDNLESKLFNVSDFGEVNSIIFNIDTLTLSNSWKACNERASSYLQTSSNEVVKSLAMCSYSPSDEQYDSDPCCNVTLSFFQCCTPKMVPVNISEFIGLNDNLIDDQCFSAPCTGSVLSEYFNSLSVVAECKVPAFVSTNSGLELREALRECKDELRSIPCTSDSDCGASNGSEFTCDLSSRYCIIPPEESDLRYLKCIFNRLPASYTYSFLNKYNIQMNDQLISNVFNAMSWEDCTYVSGTSYRSKYSYVPTSINYGYSCYSTENCMDLSCQTVHDVCFDGQIGGWEVQMNSNLEWCEDLGFCQILGCQDESSDDCKNDCNAITEYCGYCSNNFTNCFNFQELTDETQCKDPQNENVCLLPNGDYKVGVDPDECESQYGSCDTPCDSYCSAMAFTGCGLVGIDEYNYFYYFNETECLSFPNTKFIARPYPNEDICYSTVNQSQCNILAESDEVVGDLYIYYSWIDCDIKPKDECYDHIFGSCGLSYTECQTQQECENAGTCSDSYFFSSQNTPQYPDGMGKCVKGHFAYRSGFTIPTCDSGQQTDSPKGCFSYYPEYSHNKCNLEAENGFTWWAPATNQQECEAPMGCKILDNSPYNLPYNFRFNEMSEELCVGCGNDSFNSWEHLFKWKPAVWQKGIPVKSQWRSNQYIYSGVKKQVLNYQRLYEELDNSVNTHIADLYRSEVLCRMERVEGNLRSISCSCSENGSPDCFTSSSLLLGQSKPCANEESTYTFSYGQVLFNTSSVHMGCTSVLVSQVSQQLYKSTTPQTLSSNFVSYKKPNNYGVLNNNRAIIGTILGDGVTINTQGVNYLTICLQFNGTTYSKSYNIYDFAKSTSNTSLIPMEVETYTTKSNEHGTLLCASLSSFTNDDSFFPIVRLENWQEPTKEVFDKTATGLIYALACIFLVTSLWGIFQCVMVAVKKYKGIEQIRLVHSLILIVTIFITIRAIYFFIIPSGALQNNSSGDYILVVLPTFIYFTAFTIIVSLWYMIVNAKDSGRTLFKRLKAIILITNVVLYLLFIVIVLVFNFTESHPNNDCGTRIVSDVSNTTSQRVVSIVYAVIQALISLVIGAAFLYLGGSLYLSMRKVKTSRSSTGGGSTANGDGGAGGNTNQHQKKIFIVTFACSIGFIIHCIFVLILVGANPSNITFSFLGLIITEIIPSLSIFYCYNQGHFGGLKQSTNVVQLSYVTPNHEEFNSKSTARGSSRHYAGDSFSGNSSRNYSSSSG